MHRKKLLIPIFAFASAVLPAGGTAIAADPAPAATSADRAVRVVAGNCLLCHGEAAAKAGGMPILAGQEPASLSAALRAYRDGTRHGTIMPRIAKGYDDATIDAVSAYLASARQ